MVFAEFCEKIRSSTKPKLEILPTTHNCLKKVLLLAQIVGVFPLNHLNDDPENLEFRFKSWKVLYTSLISFGYLFCATFSFYKAFKIGILLNQLITPLFFFHSFMTSVLFSQLASKWPLFLNEWTKIENNLLKHYKTTTDLHKKISYSASAMIFVALLEHSLSMLNYVYSSKCENNSTGAEYFFKKQFHYVFTYMPYHSVFGLCLTFVSWTAAFVWNFGDIFIILLSIIMTERFRQINQQIKKKAKELIPHLTLDSNSKKFIKIYPSDKAELQFWRQIREDYDHLTNIIRYLDQILSNLVLLSFSCNLTFILIQLFNSLRQMKSAGETLYFFYSFGFVIMRIVCVSIFGAFINEESQAGLPYLTSLPTEHYNEEVRRLVTQTHIDLAALTGHNFFRLTKGLVLSVAAAIITYELVLIQFNQATLNKYMQANETICF
ncbi:gustatory receptor for sugar taste 64e-like [Tribolium madens]|uniref:gustatory receptor for sugar taste 64e-like n=1 Tax=Tribolium madens TaxID=41895 RepID=UPI001CF75B9D|nr:gustatory receptor for sugar taste 64e-like [Tribolium madens]